MVLCCRETGVLRATLLIGVAERTTGEVADRPLPRFRIVSSRELSQIHTSSRLKLESDIEELKDSLDIVHLGPFIFLAAHI